MKKTLMKLLMIFLGAVVCLLIEKPNIYSQQLSNEEVVIIKKSSFDKPKFDANIFEAQNRVDSNNPENTQLIVKLKENEKIDSLKSLNDKYGVVDVKNVFENQPDPEQRLNQLKDKITKLAPSHDSWYWQVDKNSKEYKDYEAKLAKEKEELDGQVKAQEELVAKLNERKKRAPEAMESPKLDNIYVLKTSKAVDMKSMVAEYKANNAVEYAEPNKKVTINVYPQTLPNDKFVDPDQDGVWSKGAWKQTYEDLWGLKQIKANEGWKISQGEGVVVAVIDTGVDYNHLDIKDNIWNNSREISGNGKDDDGNGYIDDVRGWDFVNNDKEPIDDHFHGTHCAGTIAAVGNNSFGVIGVAPKAKIMPVKGLNAQGSGSLDVLARCVRYAVDNGADILSNSWGGSVISSLLQNAFDYAASKGCVSIAGAGNDNVDAMNFSPANIDKVIAVGAFDSNLKAASFSNFGSKVDISAPGVDILSLLTGLHENAKGNENAYAKLNGTSMACPHIAGVSALILTKNPNFTWTQVRNILIQTADVVGKDVAEQEKNIGNFVNIQKALQVSKVSDAIVKFKDLSDVVKGKINLKAEITDNNFASYILYIGKGSNPSSWIQLKISNSLPGTGGLIFENFNTVEFEDGIYKLKLKEVDKDGLSVELERRIEIKNIFLNLSLVNNSFTKEEKIEIKGSVNGAQSFKLEYGIGDGIITSVTTWSSYGVILTNLGNSPIIGDVVATLDTSKLPIDKYFCFKLTATYKSGNKTEILVKNNFIDSMLKTGFPKYMSQVIAGIVVDNIRKDYLGKEIAVLLESEFLPFSTNFPLEKVFYLLDNNGNEIWSKNNYDNNRQWYYGANECSIQVPTVADLNGDGEKEISFHSGGMTALVCLLDNYGNMINEWPVGRIMNPVNELYPGMSKYPVFEDLDNDGKLEVLSIGNMYDKPSPSERFDFINVLGSNGKNIVGWPKKSVFEGFTANSPVVVGDVDNDGNKEVIVLQYFSQELKYVNKDKKAIEIKVFDAKGVLKKGWPKTIDYFHYDYKYDGDSAVIGDIDGDGYLEIIVRSNSTKGKKTLKLHIFRYDGTYLQGWPKEIIGLANTTPVLADFNKDGKLEIVLIIDNNLYILDYLGNILKGWPINFPGQNFLYYPVVVDINGDKEFEIITATKNDSYVELRVFKFDGTEILSFKRPLFYDDLEAITYYGKIFEKSIVIEDVDEDGFLDIITSVANKLYIWKTPTPYDKKYMPWPQFQHDNLHTGNYNYGESVDNTKPSKPVVTDESSLTLSATQLYSSWVCEDTKNIIVGYEYQILEGSVTGKIIRDWTSVGQIKSVTAGGLNLEVKKTYYFGVRAKSKAGVYGEVGYSDGIIVVRPNADNSVFEILKNMVRRINLSGTTYLGKPVKGAIVEFPKNGTLVETTGNASYNYTPNKDYIGTDKFTFKLIQEGVESNIATITITVLDKTNTAPVAQSEKLSVEVNKPIPVILKGTDVDQDRLTYRITKQPVNGRIAGNGFGANNYVYMPNQNYSGVDSFEFTCNDGYAESNVAVVSIQVGVDNTKPSKPVVTDESSLTLSATQLYASWVCEDAKNIIAGYEYQILEGSVTGKIIRDWTSNGQVKSVTAVGLGLEVWKTYYFGVRAKSQSGVYSEVGYSDGIIVVRPNADNSAFEMLKNMVRRINLPGTTYLGKPVKGVIVEFPKNGTLVETTGNASYNYTPNKDYTGTDKFTFKLIQEGVESNIATITITVLDKTNTAPVAQSEKLSVEVNKSITVILKGTDVDQDRLTYKITKQPVNGRIAGNGFGGVNNYVYIPNKDYIGTDTIEFTCNDGYAESNVAVVSITVGKVEAPIAYDGKVEMPKDTTVKIYARAEYLSRAGEAEAKYVIVEQPKFGTLVEVTKFGDYSYTPRKGYVGIDTLKFKVTQGTVESNVATITIKIVGQTNQSPIANSQEVITPVNMNVNVTLTGSDPDGDEIRYRLLTYPGRGRLTGIIPNFVYTPVNDFIGTVSFKFKVTDGKLDSEVAIVTIKVGVKDLNRAPVANAQSITTNVNKTASIQLTATDADQNKLTYTIVSNPKNGTLIKAAGSEVPLFSYISKIAGTDQFTFRANDGKLNSNVATVTIKVMETKNNQAPVAQSESIEAKVNQPVNIQLKGSDPDGDVLKYRLVTIPSSGKLSGNFPNLVYIPKKDFAGTVSFKFIVNDGKLNSNIATIIIKVIDPGNKAPKIIPINDVNTKVGSFVNFIVKAEDPEKDAIKYRAYDLPQAANFNSTTGSFNWTARKIGAYAVSFEAIDSKEAISERITVKIVVS